MAILELMEQGAELSARSGAIVVLRGGREIAAFPLHEVEEIHVYGGVEVLRSARNLLLARGIDTVFLMMDGRVRGRLVASEGRQAERRLSQYRTASDPQRRLPIARAIVVGKLVNQRSLILARQRGIGSAAIASTLAAMRALVPRAGAAGGIEQLLGVEGQAASLYFGTFGEIVRNPAFSWAGRNRRPPKDPINAALSYGYALLVARCESAIRAASLDPFLGILHETGRGRLSLALDLAEPFRPAVDGMVLTLFNRQQLCPEDFGPPDVERLTEEVEVDFEGAVHLGKVGREVVLRAWGRRLAERSPHPVREGDWSFAGLIRETAYALARSIVDGEPFVAPEL